MSFQFPGWGAAQMVLGSGWGQAQVVLEAWCPPPAIHVPVAVILSKDLGFLSLSPSFY